jgi:hypothetical protein
MSLIPMCKFKIKVGDTVRIDNYPVYECAGHSRCSNDRNVPIGTHGKVMAVVTQLPQAADGNYYAKVMCPDRNWRLYFFDDLTVVRKARKKKLKPAPITNSNWERIVESINQQHYDFTRGRVKHGKNSNCKRS